MAYFSKKFLGLLIVFMSFQMFSYSPSLHAEDEPARVFMGIDLKKIKNLKPDQVMEALAWLPLPMPVKMVITATMIGRKIYPMVKADDVKGNPQANQASDIISGLDNSDVNTIKTILTTFLGQFTNEDSAESQAKLAGLILSVVYTKNIDNMFVALKEMLDNNSYTKNSDRQADQSKRALVSMLVNLYEKQNRIVDIVKMTDSEDETIAAVAYLKMHDRWTNVSAMTVAKDIQALRALETEIGREELDAFLLKIKGEEKFKKTLVNAKVVGLFEGLNAGRRWTQDTIAGAKSTAERYRDSLAAAAMSTAERAALAKDRFLGILGDLRDSAAKKADMLKGGAQKRAASWMRIAGSLGGRVSDFVQGCQKDLTEGVAEQEEGGKIVEVEVLVLPAPGTSSASEAANTGEVGTTPPPAG